MKTTQLRITCLLDSSTVKQAASFGDIADIYIGYFLRVYGIFLLPRQNSVFPDCFDSLMIGG